MFLPWLQVILGILFFPSILFLLEFKSKEELQLMPQTMEEHIQELEDSDSDSDTASSDSEASDINEVSLHDLYFSVQLTSYVSYSS